MTVAGTFALNRNVRLLYAYSVCMQLQPHLAIWVVYLTGFRGLTLAQVGTLEAFFWGVSVLAEVPTGAFSDRFGRRTTFLVASAIEGVGIAAFAFAASFPLLLLSYGLWSLGLAFGSGNASAYLYDALAAAGRAADFVRHQGRLNAIGRGSFMLGAVAGGLIAGAGTLQLVILVGIAPYVAALVLAARMENPPQAAGSEVASRSYRQTLSLAYRALRADPAIRWLIMVSVVLDSLLVADWLLMQPYLESRAIPVALFGILAVPVRLSAIGAALGAHRYVAFVGLRGGLGAMIVAVTVAVAAIGLIDHRGSFAGYFVLSAGLAVIGPAIIGYLNERVPQAVRATVLSVPPLGTAATFAITGAIAGVVADASLRLVFPALGAAVLILAGGAYVLWLRADAAATPPVTPARAADEAVLAPPRDARGA